MACYRPIKAFQHYLGGPLNFGAEKGGDSRELEVPCGHCTGCLLERSRHWAVRCMHEAQLHAVNEFVTLTYSDKYVPEFGSLQYRDFQLFIRNLRLELGIFDVTLWQWLPRYFVGGEYGEQNSRPHFHALLFGCSFSDRKFYRVTPSGSNIYTSATLERLWPWGFASTGDVSFESAAYVARYCFKKVPKRGLDHDKHYAGRVPEFVRMSLKPGIGAKWLEKYSSDVFPDGRIVMKGGAKVSCPRYYDKWFEKHDPLGFEDMQFRRAEHAETFKSDCTEERLQVREQVTKARLAFKRKSI